MDFIGELWMPILVSAVFVFLASSVFHMILPIHKKDYDPVPNEGAVMDAIRAAGVKPGNYMFPHCSDYKEANTEEGKARFEKGPVGVMNVWPNGMPNMGKALGQWFLYCIVASVFVGYLGSLAIISPAPDYLDVMRFTGTAGFLAYGLGAVIDSIWKGVKWSTSFKFVFDGLVYGLVTGGTFGWLWPSAI